MLKIKIIVGVVIAVLIVTAFTHYKYLVGEVGRLNSQLAISNKTIEKLDKKVESEKVITKKTETIIKNVRRSPKKDDAPVAPVLDRAIDDLHIGLQE